MYHQNYLSMSYLITSHPVWPLNAHSSEWEHMLQRCSAEHVSLLETQLWLKCIPRDGLSNYWVRPREIWLSWQPLEERHYQAACKKQTTFTSLGTAEFAFNISSNSFKRSWGTWLSLSDPLTMIGCLTALNLSWVKSAPWFTIAAFTCRQIQALDWKLVIAFYLKRQKSRSQPQGKGMQEAAWQNEASNSAYRQFVMILLFSCGRGRHILWWPFTIGFLSRKGCSWQRLPLMRRTLWWYVIYQVVSSM